MGQVEAVCVDNLWEKSHGLEREKRDSTLLTRHLVNDRPLFKKKKCITKKYMVGQRELHNRKG